MSDDGRGDDDDTGNQGSDDDAGPNDDADDDDDEQGQCTSADLKPQARVHEAEFTKAADGSNVFTKIELVPAT
jgi:hypothetical protein